MDNSGDSGGGLVVFGQPAGGRAMLFNVSFVNNTATNVGSALAGFSVADEPSILEIESSIFVNNVHNNSMNSAGMVYLGTRTDSLFRGCTFLTENDRSTLGSKSFFEFEDHTIIVSK